MREESSNKAIPNPGSDEAVAMGCTCPVLANGRGRGAWNQGKDPNFWIDGRCPIHGDGSDWIKTREEE